MTTKRFLEETFGIIISSKAPYHAQLDSVNQSGELGNKAKLGEILFFLAEKVDQLEKQLQDPSASSRE